MQQNNFRQSLNFQQIPQETTFQRSTSGEVDPITSDYLFNKSSSYLNSASAEDILERVGRKLSDRDIAQMGNNMMQGGKNFSGQFSTSCYSSQGMSVGEVDPRLEGHPLHPYRQQSLNALDQIQAELQMKHELQMREVGRVRQRIINLQ